MNFPTEDQFPKKPLKFAELSKGIYCVMEHTERQGKYGLFYIAHLQSDDGNEFDVLLPKRLGVRVVTAGVPCYIKYDGKELNPTDPMRFFYKYNVCRYVI